MIQATDWSGQFHLATHLLAALSAGLLVGIERGWRQREEEEGMRVAGVRTFALIGTCGGLFSLVSLQISTAMAAILLSGFVILLLGAFLRPRTNPLRRDATTMVAAMTTLGLGLLAGAGYAALALAAAAVVTFLLYMREPMHGLLKVLTDTEMRAIARYGIIAIAVLPFLPDANYGPYGAWNPFKLWLVVALITGFSIAGYVANRLVGESRGTIATALIGGAYSSTAATAAFASQLKDEDTGRFMTGIALASAVMYVRVVILAALLAPSLVLDFGLLLAPATIVAFLAAGVMWRIERSGDTGSTELTRKPFELLPALGFLVVVALASLLVHWAQTEFGQQGAALSLFIAGSFDVDAALVAYSVLPEDAVAVPMAALALAGTVAVNMALKAGIAYFNARKRAGRTASLALLSSFAILVITLVVRATMLFG